ncbi:hyalin-like [Anneissia japonica]|uniref:hyalin-like n=1 Tax=Anneissia japonica TaxID=1529436 RepID=UPI001425780C|nr:hyalin-like [Anneissia japonica]
MRVNVLNGEYEFRNFEIPNVTCPDDISMSTSSSQVTVTWNNPTVTDNVDTGLSASCTPSSGSLFVLGSNDVTCGATDAAGRTGSCMFTVDIIVPAPEEPVVTCIGGVSAPTSPGQATGTVFWSEPAVTDDIDTGLTATCTPPSGSSFPVGTNTVMCTATDSDGNVGSCTITVFVRDIESPIVKCPDDISMSTSSSQVTVTWNDPTVTDNVDTDLSATCTPSSGSLFVLGSNDVTCDATDAAGRTGSCMFTVYIIVPVPEEPVLTCIGSVNVPTSPGQSIGTVTWSEPIVTDDIDMGLTATCTPPSGSSFPVGTNTAMCTATDSNGNVGSCTITVFVRDNESPNVKCPDDISMSTSSSQVSVTWNDPTVTDNVDTGLSATCTPSSGSLFVLGSNDVTCDATDAAGRTGSCTFTVYIIGSLGQPTVICPDDINQLATVTWSDPIVRDNVDSGLSATCSPSSGSSFNVGETDVTCSAVDTDGNKASCSFSVNITGTSCRVTGDVWTSTSPGYPPTRFKRCNGYFKCT